MYQSVMAQIDESGRVILMEPLRITGKRNAILTVLDDAFPGTGETPDASITDPWMAYRSRLSAAGLHVPVPGAWQLREGKLLDVEGTPVSQTLVEDRR